MEFPVLTKRLKGLTSLFMFLLLTQAGAAHAEPPTEAQVQGWLDQLATSSVPGDVRAEAAYQLARVQDERAYQALLAAARDRSRDVRANAVRGLGNFTDTEARREAVADVALAGLDDTDHLVRGMAESTAVAVHRAGGTGIAERVLAALDREGFRGGEDAAVALDRMNFAPAIPSLIRHARASSDRNVRAGAVRALGGLANLRGTNDLKPALLRALRDHDHLVRSAADTAVTRLERAGDTEVIEGVIAMASDPANGTYIENVTKVLADSRDPRVIESLISLTGHSQYLVRSGALRGFRNHASDPRLLNVAIAALRDSESDVRSRAVDALGAVLKAQYAGLSAGEKRRVLNALVARMASSDAHHRRDVAKLLGRFIAQGLSRHPDGAEISARIRECFPSLASAPGSGGPSDVGTGVHYLFDVLFFGGVPVLTVIDAAESGSGGRPASSASSEIQRWTQDDVRAFQSLIDQIVQ
ncbi:MAG: HEAT repeat domain-containing protein [Bdellovibrionales bacterium]|nr:HEAT repeat domain-containing protein [Bdellovibrionales bacterium]